MEMKPCSSTVSTNSIVPMNHPRPKVKTPPPLAPITVHFVVHCRFIRSHEMVFLTGNLERLGKWQPDQAIELVQDKQNESLWRTTIELPTEETREMLKFRYFIGYYLQGGPDPSPKIKVISRWESQRAARSLLPSVEADSNSVCRLKHIDEFGIYGGREVVSDGWLNHKVQNEILLRLHSDALKFFKPRHASRSYYLKITPFDLRHKELDDDEGETISPLPLLPSFSPTDLAILSNDDPSFLEQKPSGALFRNGVDYFIYRTQTVAVEFLAFRIEFFAERKKNTDTVSSETASAETASSREASCRENFSPPKTPPANSPSPQTKVYPFSCISPAPSTPRGVSPGRIQNKLQDEIDKRVKEKTEKKKNGLITLTDDTKLQQNGKTATPVVEKKPESKSDPKKNEPVVARAETDINEKAATESVYLFPNEVPPPANLDRVAMAYVMPSSISETFGQLAVPIISKTSQLPIGQLSIDYLSTRALSVDPKVPLTMETSFSRYWKKRKTLEVGHRGYGVSTTKFSAIRENTLHGFNHAASKGCDVVEFDVQLTKDRIPIIFHDFTVLVRVAKRSSGEQTNDTSTNQLDPNSASQTNHSDQNSLNNSLKSSHADFHEIAVKDLKLQQLHLLHIEHYQAPDHTDKLPLTNDYYEHKDLRPFPTLVDALDHVDKQVGFNIEVKYPMLMKDKSHECANFFERNEYVDLILKDVIEHSNSRRIIFSSFDPDICSMIARKQSLYPVLYLCVGATTRYMPFLDKRSSNSLTAVNFAVNAHILGLNFHSEELLRDKRPVQRAKHFNLVSFVWGDDLDIPANVEYFRSELQVEGIVYDKIGESEKRRNCFVVEREVKSILFSPNVSASPSRRQSVDDSATGLTSVATMPLLNPPTQRSLTKEEMGSTEALLLADMRPRSPFQQQQQQTMSSAPPPQKAEEDESDSSSSSKNSQSKEDLKTAISTPSKEDLKTAISMPSKEDLKTAQSSSPPQKQNE